METLQDGKNLIPSHSDVPDPDRAPQVPLHERVAEEPCLATAGCKNVTPVLNRVGDKWSMQIVMQLAGGLKRFSELKRALDGVSQRMLTLSLRGLERDGLISRHVTPTIPPRVDYELTELGISLREPVIALGQWALDHIDCIRAAQQRYDAAHDDPD